MDVAGEDLSWFWRGLNTIGVWSWESIIKYVKTIQKRVVITVETLKKMPMPVIIDVKLKSGK
jgi:hypothetical protein